MFSSIETISWLLYADISSEMTIYGLVMLRRLEIPKAQVLTPL